MLQITIIPHILFVRALSRHGSDRDDRGATLYASRPWSTTLSGLLAFAVPMTLHVSHAKIAR